MMTVTSAATQTCAPSRTPPGSCQVRAGCWWEAVTSDVKQVLMHNEHVMGAGSVPHHPVNISTVIFAAAAP